MRALNLEEAAFEYLPLNKALSFRYDNAWLEVYELV